MNVIASFRQLSLQQKTGWILYAVSMVIPACNLSGIGAEWFIIAPVYGVFFLFSGSVASFLVGLALLAGVAANASLFSRARLWQRVAGIVAPWIAYAAFCFVERPANFEQALAIPYFFPWAVGIALINVARIRNDLAQHAGLAIGSNDRGVASSVSQGGSR
jgi:hypothetical protein